MELSSANQQAKSAGSPRTMTCNQISSCPDMEQTFVDLYKQCKSFTMTSLERMYSLYKAIQYITDHKIAGDITECGVWKGGSCMLGAMSLIQFDDTDRNIYLYDTFDGMPDPTEKDVDYNDQHASMRLNEKWPTFQAMANQGIDQVKTNLLMTGYPEKKMHFIKGRVEQTIPQTVPDKIAILRLDTDWYESTRHEMIHLFPRLVSHGVLIVDDYGHWKGARQAVDEYIGEHNIQIMLHRNDYTGRTGIKP